ncbi:cation diffusion facilitator family transporter [Tsuneonella sp. SYSU-LHT278]|uniref:cation diffusion facilitator family transporter n=1 Tax=Tsuneonella sediminis TaxID=3416089 RepID=UPI003F7A7795
MNGPPEAISRDLERAKKLEWWTLGWMASVVVVMYLVMGASQAMKTAFLEDLLSLVPAVTFLMSAHLEPRGPTRKYPFGFVRANTLAFLASAVVLLTMGLFLIFESARALVNAEHPTIGPVALLGETVWLGWLMIAGLVYSVVPPMILGRLKMPLAHRLRDKVLYTDALMQKADWRTGLAGVAGVLGIGFGLWWADALAALLIALSIVKDGFDSVRRASAELLDGAPRQLEGNGISEEAANLENRIKARWPEAEVRMRESGRYILVDVKGVREPVGPIDYSELMDPGAPWRVAQIAFIAPRRDTENSGEPH